jgi:DHA1 family multidrug resistance protein-like MFS transporter
MYDTIRDSPFGQIARFLTKNTYFQYVEEKEGFQHPYYGPDLVSKETEGQDHATDTTSNTLPEETTSITSVRGGSGDMENGHAENPIERVITLQSYHEAQRTESRSIQPTQTSDGMILVDWYTTGTVPFAYKQADQPPFWA